MVRNLNKTKKLTILLIVILLTMTVVTVAQAQEETVDESDIPDWIYDSGKDIPLIGAFLGFGLLLCCVFFLIPLIIAILLCIWIYKDAERRGKQGILWVLLLILATVFLNIVGLIIVIVVWLVVRPKEEKPST